MTSSNENSVNQMPKPEEWRKSRTFTWMAVVASILAVAVFGYMLLKVNVLETEYGEIRGNKERILRQIENREEQHAELLAKIERLEIDKSLLEDDVAVSRVRQEKLAALNEEVSSSEATLKSLQGAIIEADQKLMEKESVEIALETLRGDQGELVEKKDRLNAEIAGLQREVNTANDDARDAKNKRDQMQDEVSDLRDKKLQRDDAEGELNAAQNALTAIQDKIRSADRNLSEKEALALDAERRFTQAEKDLTSLTARIATRETELESKRNDANAEATRLAGLERDRENLSEQVDRLKAEETRLKLFVERNAKAEATLESTSQALQLARDEKTEIEAELVAKRNEIQDERIKFSEVKAEVAVLRQNISMLETGRQDATNKRDAVDTEILAKSQTRDTLAEQLKAVSANLASETALLAQKSGERIAEEARLADLQTKAMSLREVEAKLAELQPQLDARQNAAKVAEISLAEAEAALESTSQALQLARDEKTDIEAEMAAKRSEIQGEQIKISELKAEVTVLRQNMSMLETGRQDATNKRDAVDTEILAKSQTRDTLAEQLKAVSANLASETALLAQKSGERIAEEARLADLQTKAMSLREVEAKLAELQPQLDARQNAAKVAETSLAELSGKIEAEQISLRSLRQEVNGASSDLASLNDRKSNLEAGISELAGKKAEVEEQVAELEQRVTDLESSVKPQPTDPPTGNPDAQLKGGR